MDGMALILSTSSEILIILSAITKANGVTTGCKEALKNLINLYLPASTLEPRGQIHVAITGFRGFRAWNVQGQGAGGGTFRFSRLCETSIDCTFENEK